MLHGTKNLISFIYSEFSRDQRAVSEERGTLSPPTFHQWSAAINAVSNRR